MGKLFSKMVCFTIICVLILSFVCINAIGYSVYSYQGTNNNGITKLLSDNNSVFLINSEGNDITIEQLYNNNYEYTASCTLPIADYTVSDNSIVMLSPDENENQTLISILNLNSTAIKSFYIKGYLDSTYSILLYSDYMYVIDSNNRRMIRKYTTKGKLLQTLNIGCLADGIFKDSYGDIYLSSGEGLFRLENDKAYKICSEALAIPFSYLGENIVSDWTGKVFLIHRNFADVFRIDQADTSYPTGGLCSNYIIVSNNNTIYALDKNNLKALKKLNTNYDIIQLCCADDKIFALTSDLDIVEATVSEFSDIKDSKGDNNTSNGDTNQNSDFEIYSDTYNVDNDNMYISNITSGTTVAKFKSNISYEGYTLTVTNYKGKVIKSGKIGTSAVARFENDYNIYEYELSIDGDITGEGNVNSRDKNLMFDYLLDKVTFSGVFNISADLNNDGIIDCVDLLLLARKINSNT